jgi:hypothetical protein
MLETSLLDRVLNQVGEHANKPDDELVTLLREVFSGVHFSVCNDEDLPPHAKPAAGNAFCRLYYVDSSAHCLQLTSDAEAATGLVVGLLDEEDDEER